MKRLIAAAVLAVIVISVHLTGRYIINNTLTESRELLKACTQQYMIDKSAYSQAERLEKFWSDNEGILSLFANHEGIDDIELAISSLKVYSDTEDNEIFYEYAASVETLLHQLEEDNSLNMHSVF